MNNDIHDTLKERSSEYGDYGKSVEARARVLKIINAIHFDKHGCALSATDTVTITDLLSKVFRLATSPKHIDTWHDIAGYAILTEIYLKGVNKNDV